MNFVQEHKSVSIAIVGLIVGGILSFIIVGGAGWIGWSLVGGIAGFLVGWLWQKTTEGSSDSGGS